MVSYKTVDMLAEALKFMEDKLSLGIMERGDNEQDEGT